MVYNDDNHYRYQSWKAVYKTAKGWLYCEICGAWYPSRRMFLFVNEQFPVVPVIVLQVHDYDSNKNSSWF